LEVIQSTENYYCIIRAASANLMKSDNLIICDDDVIPDADFIQFFISGQKKHPKDVLCVRGHYFLTHKIRKSNPEKLWQDYEFVRFAHDDSAERLIHFVHADACLFPRQGMN
jgi:hypothetical protein